MTSRACFLWAVCILAACGVSERREFLPGSDYRGETPTAPQPTVESDVPLLVVPPDGARVGIGLSVEGEGARATASRVRAAVGTLTDAAAGGEGCVVTWDDYEPPAARSGDTFAARAHLRLHVELAGLPDTAARADRLDDCLQRVSDMSLGDGVRSQLSAPVVTLERTDAHRAALLELRLAPLRALGEPTAVFEPARCRSSGAVSILERHLSGVTLGLDFHCDGMPAAAG